MKIINNLFKSSAPQARKIQPTETHSETSEPNIDEITSAEVYTELDSNESENSKAASIEVVAQESNINQQIIESKNVNTDNEEKVISIADDAPIELIPLSLLSNGSFIKLVEEIIDIMNEFESYTDRLVNEEAKIIVHKAIDRLQESLERSGLSRIENEKSFAILRHIPVPMVRVSEGQAVLETISPGLVLENRVFRKAKVVIKQ